MAEFTSLKYLLVLVLLIPAYAQDKADGPSMIFPTEAIDAYEGEAVELPCGVRGEKRGCAWEHGGGAEVQVEDVLDETNPLERYDKPKNSNDNQCGITIKSVAPYDSGTWTCKIHVPRKTLQKTLNLTVLAPPVTRAPRNIDQQDDTSTPTENGDMLHDFTATPVSEYSSYYEGDLDEDYHQDNESTPDPDYYDYLNNLDKNFTAFEPRNGKGGDSNGIPTQTAEPELDHYTTQGHDGKHPHVHETHPTDPSNHDDHYTDQHPYPQPGPQHPHPQPEPDHTDPQPTGKPVSKNQVDDNNGGSSSLWIGLVVILVIMALLALCFWYFFGRNSQSHDITQMEGGKGGGVEMSPIVQDNGDLETIVEEQSSSQLLSDVKVEVHNEQDLDAKQGKEEEKGISNKAFNDQEEINKEDDKPEADQSDKNDQKDLSKDDDDEVDKLSSNEKNNDTNSDTDSKSIESISSDAETIGDKDVHDVCDENKDSDNKDDDAALDDQAQDLKDDDKETDTEAKDKNHDDSFGDKSTQDDTSADELQDSPTSQQVEGEDSPTSQQVEGEDSPTSQQVEGEDSPFQDAVFLNMHNGEVYEEEAKDKTDGDDTNKE